MGGRDGRPAGQDREEYPEREAWVMEVSDERLTKYERMLSSPTAAGQRLDGSKRIAEGDYFRDLIQRERERRSRSLF